MNRSVMLLFPDPDDMRAIYLRSLSGKTTAEEEEDMDARFRVRPDHAGMDVFSQVPREDSINAEYEEDSFCVGDDYQDTGMETILLLSLSNYLHLQATIIN